jgi:hypothetical protein
MGRQHRAAVAALDLDPLPASWASCIAWHMPDAEPQPVLRAGWQTIARWLKRPDPGGEAARRYVKRVISKLIELGLLERVAGVLPRLGQRAAYVLRISRNVDGQGDTGGGQLQASTPDSLSPSMTPFVPLHTMYLDLGTKSEVPTGQLALPGDWKRPCEHDETKPTTAGGQPRHTATFSTTSSSRSTRLRMRSRRHVVAAWKRPAEESEVAKKAKQPTLFEVPAPLIASGQPGDATAHVIVGEWLARCQVRPPGRIIGQVGKLIKEMLAEGVDADHVRRGCAVWMRSGKHPAVLPSMVHEQQVMHRPPAQDDAPAVRGGRDQTVAEWLEWAAKLEAEAGAGPQWAVGA